MRKIARPEIFLTALSGICYHGRNMQAKPLIIGVAGGTGSGKTTIANAIIEKIGIRGRPGDPA